MKYISLFSGAEADSQTWPSLVRRSNSLEIGGIETVLDIRTDLCQSGAVPEGMECSNSDCVAEPAPVSSGFFAPAPYLFMAGRAADTRPFGERSPLVYARVTTLPATRRARVVTLSLGLFKSRVGAFNMSTAILPANISIGNIPIHQQEGLYSLNDLHQASGGDPNHRPGNFLGIEQTKSLIAEILNAGISAFKTTRGKYGGTYACKELVIGVGSAPSFI